MTVSVKEKEELPQREMLKKEEIHLFIHSFIHSFFEKITGTGEYIERDIRYTGKIIGGRKDPQKPRKGIAEVNEV